MHTATRTSRTRHSHRRGSARWILLTGGLVFCVGVIWFLLSMEVPVVERTPSSTSDEPTTPADVGMLPAPQIDEQLAQQAIADMDRLMAAGQYQAAIERGYRLEPSLPNHLGLQVRICRCMIEFGQLDTALERLLAVLEIDPEQGAAHRYAGVIYRRQNKLQLSADHLRRAVELIPQAAGIHYDYARTLSNMNDYREAIIQYEKGSGIHPMTAQVHNDWGIALFQTRQFTESVWHYGEAVKLRPDYADAYFNMGASLEQMQRLDEAVTAYEQAKAIDPTHPAADRLIELLQSGG